MKNLNKKATEQHILDCVYNNEGEDFTNIDEAKEHIKKEFERVANYPANLVRFPNEFNRFSDYLNGAPFSFEIYYSEIAKELKVLLNRPDRIIDNYSGKQLDYYYHVAIYKIVFGK